MYRIVLLKMICAILLLISSCGGGDSSVRDEAGPLMGFGFSPRGFPITYENSEEFLTEVGKITNGSVMYNGSWRDSLENSGEIPSGLGSFIRACAENSIVPIFVFGWRSGTTLYLDHPADATNSWENDNTQAAYINMLRDFAEEFHPPYIFLGNENEGFYENYPEQYAAWIEVYNLAYDSVKAVSASTSVGPVFNYEKISGNGGLNGWTGTYWEALESHDLDKVDVLGLTTYPFFQYASVNEIPVDYLSEFFSRIGSKPVFITETGWPAEAISGHPRAWDISEALQVEYAELFPSLISSRDISGINWLFLFPMEDVSGGTNPLDDWITFGSISLKKSNGENRPVYSAWLGG